MKTRILKVIGDHFITVEKNITDSLEILGTQKLIKGKFAELVSMEISHEKRNIIEKWKVIVS